MQRADHPHDLGGAAAPRPVAARAFYLDAGGEAVYARFDAPGDAAPRRGVLLLGPFGWEEVCSYRPRRTWARHLAGEGAAVLRIDLPGSGDSAGGPGDPARLEAWTAAALAAAAWLSAETGGTRRLTLVGLGLGGLVGWRAVAAGAPVDDLVLWGVPARGRSLVREVRAFSRLERSRLQELNPGRTIDDDEDGALSAAGFCLSAETTEALGGVDLAELALPGAEARRVLLLGRDGTSVDRALADAATAGGLEVALDEGHGWGAMVDEPDVAVAPWPAIARVDAWLDAAPAGAPAARPAAALPDSSPAATIVTPAGPAVRETPLAFGGADGILAEPLEAGGAPALTLLLLNAGSVRRIGPNRMWVEIARRWAARGVPSLRIDLPAIGEADGPENVEGEVARYYQPLYVETVRALLGHLEARHGAARFGALGLCSGAYWALQAAAQDDRVDAAYLINSAVLVWDRERLERRDTRKLGYLARSSTYRRVLRGDIPLGRGAQIARAILRRALRAAAARLAGRPRAASDPVDALLDGVRDAGKRAYLLFTGAEALHDELARNGQLAALDRWPNLRVETLDELRDVHTLRPRAVQRRVHARVDAAIAQDVAAAAQPAGAGTLSP